MKNKKTLLLLFAMFVIWLVIQVGREKSDSRIGHLNDQNFATALADHPVLLVEFGAPWCGPCRQVQPALNRLVEEYGHEVAFYEVNIDRAPQLRDRYASNGIPLVALFMDGEEKDALLGAQRYEIYRDLILQHVYPQKEPATP